MIYAGLLVFFVLEYLRVVGYVPGLELLHLNTLVPALIFLATLTKRGKVSNEEVLNDNTGRAIVVLLGVIVSSFVVAAVSLKAFEVFTTVLGYSLIFFVIAKNITEWSQIKGIFKTLIFIHITLAALTPGMLIDPSVRHYMAAGTFLGDGNDYALSVNLCIPMALFLMMDAERLRTKMLWGAVILFLVICVVATQSRGGTLALGFVVLYYWWRSPKKAVTGGMAALGLIAVMAFAPPVYFQRMNTMSSGEIDGSAQGRLIAWQAGTGMMLSNPLLGVGAGQFPNNFTLYAPGDETRWKTAHSIYFLILGELGLPGLGVLLYFIFSNLSRNKRLVREVRQRPDARTNRHVQLLTSLSVCVSAYAIAGAFLSAAYYPHMFVLSGLLFASRRLVTEEAMTRPAAEAALAGEVAEVKTPLSRLHGPLLGRRPVERPAGPAAEMPPDGRFF